MIVKRAEITSFYDEFSNKLVADYVNGNLRIESAIEFVNSHITSNTETVLDVGCGIGASSYAYLERYPGLKVTGVDISPNNIKLAQKLFGEDHEDLEFRVSDLGDWPENDRFDLLAMIDVYEHIPSNSRENFHRSLAAALKPQGRVVMSVPSLLHQNYLRENNPDGLQIVDEDVELSDVISLANSIGGVVTRYEHVSIWNTNDYVYVAIEREPQYINRYQVALRSSSISMKSRFSERLCKLIKRLFRMDKSKSRKRLVEQKLNISFPVNKP